jgi:DNA-binding transcriptional ArsR family regulator
VIATGTRERIQMTSPMEPTPHRSHDLDLIWKALADETRRSILDCLRDGPKTTTEIVERFPELSRFGVMKHIQVLREAGLILTREEGRTCVNSLNAVPIRQIYERWVSKFAEHWATTLLGLKTSLEKTAEEDAKSPRSRTKK